MAGRQSVRGVTGLEAAGKGQGAAQTHCSPTVELPALEALALAAESAFRGRVLIAERSVRTTTQKGAKRA